MATNLLQQLRNSWIRGRETSSWHLPGTSHEMWFIHIAILFVYLPYWWSHLQTDKIADKKLTVPCNLECTTTLVCFSSCESTQALHLISWDSFDEWYVVLFLHWSVNISDKIMPFPVRKTEKVILLIKTVFFQLILHTCFFSLHSLRIRPMGLARCRKDFFFFGGGWWGWWWCHFGKQCEIFQFPSRQSSGTAF